MQLTFDSPAKDGFFMEQIPRGLRTLLVKDFVSTNVPRYLVMHRNLLLAQAVILLAKTCPALEDKVIDSKATSIFRMMTGSRCSHVGWRSFSVDLIDSVSGGPFENNEAQHEQCEQQWGEDMAKFRQDKMVSKSEAFRIVAEASGMSTAVLVLLVKHKESLLASLEHTCPLCLDQEDTTFQTQTATFRQLQHPQQDASWSRWMTSLTKERRPASMATQDRALVLPCLTGISTRKEEEGLSELQVSLVQ
jgi:hypothetical protein